MRAVPKIIILSSLLAFASCGKDNESGKRGGHLGNPLNSGIPLCMQYSPNGQCLQQQTFPNSTSNNVNIGQVIAENPCTFSGWGQPNMQRIPLQQQVNIGSVVANGDMYVGVTSYGDVAAIVGNGTATPTFVGYMCPRPVGPGQLHPQILIGAYTDCAVKAITVANVQFPDGTQANFRSPSPGGSSRGQRFSFCQR